MYSKSLRKKLSDLKAMDWKYNLKYNTDIIDFFETAKDYLDNGRERLRYGIGHRDAWWLGDYLCLSISNGLHILKDIEHGYPGRKPYETMEKWEDKLEEMAEKFSKCISSDELDEEDSSYKTYKNYLKMKEEYGENSEITDLACQNWLNDIELCRAKKKELRRECFLWLAENCDDLWD